MVCMNSAIDGPLYNLEKVIQSATWPIQITLHDSDHDTDVGGSLDGDLGNDSDNSLCSCED